MPKKVNVAGESYIVSEDVDFDQLDTESMVEKDIAAAELAQAAKATSDALLTSISKRLNQQKTVRPKRPVLEFYLKFARKIYVFRGEIFWAEAFETTAGYRLVMPEADALRLYNLMLRSQSRFSAGTKLILFLKSIIHMDGEEPIEYTPPKGKNGITAQKLDRVKLVSKSLSKSNRSSYVEIEFASIHWR